MNTKTAIPTDAAFAGVSSIEPEKKIIVEPKAVISDRMNRIKSAMNRTERERRRLVSR